MQEICYLCGREIKKKERTLDHVPPKQFFPSDLPKKDHVQLMTLPTHKACNKGFQKDEDYFRLSIGASACDNPVLNSLWKDMARSVYKTKTRPLRLMVFKEFKKEVKTPSGLVLPGIIAKTFYTERIFRIIWKITRGVYFNQFSKILPESTEHFISYVQKSEPMFAAQLLRNLFGLTLKEQELGDYKEIFSYRFFIPPKKDFLSWIILFWSRHPFFIFHHASDCTCNRCQSRPGNV